MKKVMPGKNVGSPSDAKLPRQAASNVSNESMKRPMPKGGKCS